MSTLTTRSRTTVDLTSRVLPRWAPILAAIVALQVGYVLVEVLGDASPFTTGLVGALLFVALLTGASLAVEGARRAKDRFATSLVYGSFLIAVAPLISVLWLVVSRGAERFDLIFFTRSLRNVGARDDGGGAVHAIVGTLQQVGLASAMSVPLGVLAAVYLVEYGRGPLARAISFFVDVMTGLPSIVAGLFVLAFWILLLGQDFSGFAGALALAILMLPVVTRSVEEMLKLVPNELREAAFALGVPRWRTIVKVVLPTALPGVMTGVMLAVARVTGETAPLLLTVFGNPAINNNPLDGPQSALPLYVFQQAGLPNQAAIDRAWTGALTLILLVMALNLAARLVARLSAVRTSR